MLAFVRGSALSVADLYLLNLSSDLHASGEPRRLTVWNQATTSPAWTPDGRSAIHFYSFASGKSRPVVAVGETTQGISVSPDGHSLLYCQIDERRSDLMLVENFR